VGKIVEIHDTKERKRTQNYARRVRLMKANGIIYSKVQNRLKGYRWIGFAGPARAGRESKAVDD
jgi:hypothetical protein